jgi:hypothetical protein
VRQAMAVQRRHPSVCKAISWSESKHAMGNRSRLCPPYLTKVRYMPGMKDPCSYVWFRNGLVMSPARQSHDNGNVRNHWRGPAAGIRQLHILNTHVLKHCPNHQFLNCKVVGKERLPVFGSYTSATLMLWIFVQIINFSRSRVSKLNGCLVLAAIPFTVPM